MTEVITTRKFEINSVERGIFQEVDFLNRASQHASYKKEYCYLQSGWTNNIIDAVHKHSNGDSVLITSMEMTNISFLSLIFSEVSFRSLLFNSENMLIFKVLKTSRYLIILNNPQHISRW